MTAEEAAKIILDCEDELPFYAEFALRILDKAGALGALVPNRAQLELHRRLQEQREKTGKVRALILKGRQQGISTYLQARLRWLLRKNDGWRAFTLAHEQAASDNLFAMAKRYHDNEPEFMRPGVAASNAKELTFARGGSKLSVATAGTKEVGRSATAQVLHASEYAFWSNAESHWAGIGQVIPDLPGTEVWIETTANGVHNDFYVRWRNAINGIGEYIAVFLPWFWQPEYRKPVGKDWARTSEEEELAELYGLDDEQLAFRRSKVENDFNGDATKFQQEYPCNWQEAFVAEQRDTFIPGRLVMRARAAEAPASGPLIAACDPARYGNDKTAIVVRQGRKERFKKRYEGKNTMEVAGIIARFIEQYQPAAFFLDTIGIGAGIYDRLAELGYCGQDDPDKNVVIAVNFAEKAADEEHYVNKRAECWGEMKRWLESFPASLSDDDAWLADLTAPGYAYDSAGRLRLESKEQMRKRGVPSPDLGDALAMTFAEPVRERTKRAAALEKPVVYDEVVGW